MPPIPELPKKPWSSNHTGWIDRSTSSSPSSSLNKDNLLLAVSISAPVRSYPLFAVFSPNIAVLSTGATVEIKEEDKQALLDLAKQVNDLPEVGAGGWRLKHFITSRPFYRLHYPKNGELKVTEVYGFQKGLYELSKPVDEITELPDVLREIFGLSEEASSAELEETGKGLSGNDDALAKVKEILGIE